MYDKARKIIADALVNGKQIIIEGGEYQLCEHYQSGCKHGCGKKCQFLNLKNEKKGLNNMKTFIAVTYENGEIFQHFGHTETFKIYDIADGKVVSAEVVDTNGSGHGALAGFLVAHGVDTLICGGIGGGAPGVVINPIKAVPQIILIHPKVRSISQPGKLIGNTIPERSSSFKGISIGPSLNV